MYETDSERKHSSAWKSSLWPPELAQVYRWHPSPLKLGRHLRAHGRGTRIARTGLPETRSLGVTHKNHLVTELRPLSSFPMSPHPMWPLRGLACLIGAAGQTGSCSAGADACTEEQATPAAPLCILLSLGARMGWTTLRSVPPTTGLSSVAWNAGRERGGADQESVHEPPAESATTDGCVLDIQCSTKALTSVCSRSKFFDCFFLCAADYRLRWRQRPREDALHSERERAKLHLQMLFWWPAAACLWSERGDSPGALQWRRL